MKMMIRRKMNEFNMQSEIAAVESLLLPCSSCKGKAEVLAVTRDVRTFSIDEVGCVNCHLSVKRIWDIPPDNPPKLFSKWSKDEVDVIEVWNRRALQEQPFVEGLQDNMFVARQLELKRILVKNQLSTFSLQSISIEDWQKLDKELEMCQRLNVDYSLETFPLIALILYRISTLSEREQREVLGDVPLYIRTDKIFLQLMEQYCEG